MTVRLLAFLLSDLGRDAVKVAAGLVLALCLALAFVVASLGSILAAAAPGHAIASANIDDIPAAQITVMQQAAARCGLPWQVLAAVAKVNGDFGQSIATDGNDTVGYGQLPASAWSAHGSGRDPADFQNALPAIASYLCAAGAQENLRPALATFNRTDGFADQVMAVAVRYGYLQPGAPTAQVLDLARAQTGKPYVWGGASPATSFDCSGLVQWTFGQIGVRLPRTAQQQFNATVRLSRDQLQPGDLVFFAGTYPSAEPITHVGIYVGNGRMINAPSEGDVVREMPAFSGYWAAHYAGAGRVRR